MNHAIEKLVPPTSTASVRSVLIPKQKGLGIIPQVRREITYMLYYALLFLLVAIVAGVLGFGGIAFAAAGIAKILFFVFIVLFLVGLFMHLGRGRAL